MKDVMVKVSMAALKKTGNFTVQQILIDADLDDKYKKDKNIERLAVDKLNTMCEFGLIGRTSLYYFSVN